MQNLAGKDTTRNVAPGRLDLRRLRRNRPGADGG
jgi:hypothetical protein